MLKRISTMSRMQNNYILFSDDEIYALFRRHLKGNKPIATLAHYVKTCLIEKCGIRIHSSDNVYINVPFVGTDIVVDIDAFVRYYDKNYGKKPLVMRLRKVDGYGDVNFSMMLGQYVPSYNVMGGKYILFSYHVNEMNFKNEFVYSELERFVLQEKEREKCNKVVACVSNRVKFNYFLVLVDDNYRRLFANLGKDSFRQLAFLLRKRICPANVNQYFYVKMPFGDCDNLNKLINVELLIQENSGIHVFSLDYNEEQNKFYFKNLMGKVSKDLNYQLFNYNEDRNFNIEHAEYEKELEIYFRKRNNIKISSTNDFPVLDMNSKNVKKSLIGNIIEDSDSESLTDLEMTIGKKNEVKKNDNYWNGKSYLNVVQSKKEEESLDSVSDDDLSLEDGENNVYMKKLSSIKTLLSRLIEKNSEDKVNNNMELENKIVELEKNILRLESDNEELRKKNVELEEKIRETNVNVIYDDYEKIRLANIIPKMFS